jgi:hypothetical protein
MNLCRSEPRLVELGDLIVGRAKPQVGGSAREARTMSIVTLATGLLRFSAALFAVTGLSYLAVPGMLLAVVEIESTSTTDFLLRTVGVALLCAAGFVWATRDVGPRQMRLILVGLGVYYVLSSVVDIAAFAQGVVGTLSLPSAAARIVIGSLCFQSVARISSQSQSGGRV